MWVEILFSFFPFLKFCLFLERGREEEVKRNVDVKEKHRLVVPHPGTRHATQACTLTRNQTQDPSLCGMMPNQLNTMIRASFSFLKKWVPTGLESSGHLVGKVILMPSDFFFQLCSAYSRLRSIFICLGVVQVLNPAFVSSLESLGFALFGDPHLKSWQPQHN